LLWIECLSSERTSVPSFSLASVMPVFGMAKRIAP
jgi:hypothetical protein